MKLFALVLSLAWSINSYAQSPQQSSIKPYSNSVSSNGLVFVSGQLGVDPMSQGSDSFEAEVQRAISNVETILR